ncbi:DMT family transporter [Psittacicella gerlachiana]|nr:DMT family transporter [Psittacicella gerlachiana]
MALFYKLIDLDLSIYDKVFARGALSLVVSLLVIRALRQKQQAKNYASSSYPAYFVKQGNYGVMFIRCAMGFMGVITYVYTVNVLSLADADMMTKLTTVFIILCSLFWRQSDKITVVQLGVVVISLIGAALIIKPSFDNPQLFGYGIGLICAFTGALAYLAVRHLVSKAKNLEHPLSVESSLALFMLLVTLYPCWQGWQGISGKEQAYLYLLAAGMSAVVSQYAFSFALKYASAVEVNVYNYSSLLWSSLFGFIFFNFIPDFWSILGYICIVSGGLSLYFFSKRKA